MTSTSKVTRRNDRGVPVRAWVFMYGTVFLTIVCADGLAMDVSTV